MPPTALGILDSPSKLCPNVTGWRADPESFKLASSLYGPGVVGAWVLTIFSVGINWTKLSLGGGKLQGRGAFSTDFLALLAYPVVAAGHLLAQEFAIPRNELGGLLAARVCLEPWDWRGHFDRGHLQPSHAAVELIDIQRALALVPARNIALALLGSIPLTVLSAPDSPEAWPVHLTLAISYLFCGGAVWLQSLHSVGSLASAGSWVWWDVFFSTIPWWAFCCHIVTTGWAISLLGGVMMVRPMAKLLLMGAVSVGRECGVDLVGRRLRVEFKEASGALNLSMMSATGAILLGCMALGLIYGIMILNCLPSLIAFLAPAPAASLWDLDQAVAFAIGVMNCVYNVVSFLAYKARYRQILLWFIKGEGLFHWPV